MRNRNLEISMIFRDVMFKLPPPDFILGCSLKEADLLFQPAALKITVIVVWQLECYQLVNK